MQETNTNVFLRTVVKCQRTAERGEFSLAKVGVEGSNPFARSKHVNGLAQVSAQRSRLKLPYSYRQKDYGGAGRGRDWSEHQGGAFIGSASSCRRAAQNSEKEGSLFKDRPREHPRAASRAGK